ncbi:FAD-binding domain-containing protein [Thetidibacter halocola]|uniref:FAD-binding domain-containing protein n=1 Tax=Thetidibacter halocola TaxID=2827239 RepID=UPI0031FEE6ED
MTRFTPTRTAALERLSAFVPHAGKDYAALRNYDRGPGQHRDVSVLSPYIRHRALTEAEVLEAVLGRHSHSAAEKFIQEVCWRTYWKGWLEMRPSVWRSYRADLRRALDGVQTQGGLRRDWEAACKGETGIECFDFWARELVETGYLHNHARMWFASIWIFTLRLPWVLGADFFLRHLLDGDPASNTLSWRWVAGVQTPGKTYLARGSNISKYTEGRFRPDGWIFANDAQAVDAPPHPPRMDAPKGDAFDPAIPTAFILHEDDLSPGFLVLRGLRPLGTALVTASDGLTPLRMAPRVTEFRTALARDAASRWAERLGPVTEGLDCPQALADWARALGAEQIVTAFAPVGPVAEMLDEITGIPVLRVMRDFDATAWPHATAGFFKFKEKIPKFLGQLKGLRAA